MTIQILLLLTGLALVVLGADWLVDGASAIARKSGISEFVIGLTIVGFGTSCPELVVSLTGAIAGNSDISIGNVVGSNIFNTMLILGLTAILAPIGMTSSNRKVDIPITIGATVLLVLFGMKHSLFGIGQDGLSRAEGIVFLVIFVLYMYFCFKNDSKNITGGEEEVKVISIPKAVFLCLAGLAGLVFGGRFFVSSASYIAKAIGVSDKFIAITILAGGTSLPELATCVVAAIKKKDQLALGNILGSNVFNIFLILGCSAVVYPLSFEEMNLVDMGTLLLSAILLFIFCHTGNKNKMDRLEGSILLFFYVAYMVWLFKTA